MSADQLPTLNGIFTKITNSVNNIEFGSVANGMENVWCNFLVVEGVSAANTVCSAAHTLGRKPSGTIVIWVDTPTQMYKPTAAASADTDTTIFYAFSTSGTSTATSAVSAILLLI